MNMKKNKGKIIRPAGIRDEAWVLPAEVCWLGKPVMWLAVAWWVRLMGRPVSSTEISQAFGISVRRASDVVTYIITNCKNNVRLDYYVEGAEGGGRVRFLQVHDVMIADGVQPRDTVSSPGNDSRTQLKQEREIISALGRFFLHGGRRTGLNNPDI